MVGTQLEGTMNESTVQELRAKLRGELITPTDLTYETARKRGPSVCPGIRATSRPMRRGGQ